MAQEPRCGQPCTTVYRMRVNCAYNTIMNKYMLLVHQYYNIIGKEIQYVQIRVQYMNVLYVIDKKYELPLG